MSRLFTRTLTVEQAARLRAHARRVDPNPHVEALARCARIIGAIVAFALVLAVITAVDVAIWVPHLRQ
jgi:hypothetical protein